MTVWGPTGIAATADDAEELAAGGTCETGSSDLELGYESGSAKVVGLWYDNITIPNGYTIDSAYIQFEADESTTETTNLTIHCQDADDPPTFAATSNNIYNRPRTTASVAWSNIPSWNVGERGANQKTPDLASIVQEVVSRGGWASGQAMVFLFSGTGARVAESDPGGDSAALTITYSEPAASGYGNDVFTVPSANIGKVFNVATANIDKVFGS